MIIRNLCQKDYAKAPINKAKGINEACVLSCVQMIGESKSGKTIPQDAFYDMCLENLAIRKDCYINSYDRALTPFIGLPTFPDVTWEFSHDMADLTKQLAKNNPVICFLGGHAVLAIDIIDDHKAAPTMATAINPKYRGDQALFVLYVEKIKRLGFYQ